MNKQLSKFITFSLFLAMSISSCTKNVNNPNGDPGQDPGQGQGAGANTVSGIVTDAQGHPMSGVKVRAENPTGDNIFVEGKTDANGKYTLGLTSIGGWKIYAWKDAEYKGKIYHLRMGMKDDAAYEPFTPGNKGVVRDFVWKLSGRIPDRDISIENGTGVFGASMRFVNNNGVVPPMEPGTKVTVTLAPVSGATYLDGTAATEAGTIHKTFNIVNGSNNQNYYINDIPVTEYHLSIESESNGVKKQVYVGGDSFTQLYEWIEFDFDPAGGSYGSYESGLKSPNDFLYYMGQKD